MNFLCFFALGPKHLDPVYLDPLPYLKDTFKLHHQSSELDQKVNHCSKLWSNFQNRSHYLTLSSLSATCISLGLTFLSSSAITVALLVSSVVLTCFSARRSLEATHYRLIFDRKTQAELIETKKIQLSSCQRCLDFYESLEIGENKRQFLDDFFSNNFFNEDADITCSALYPFFDYYIQLKNSFENYTKQAVTKSDETWIARLKEISSARVKVLKENASRVLRSYEKDEDDYEMMKRVEQAIIKKIELQPEQLLNSLDSEIQFFKKMIGSILRFKTALLLDEQKKVSSFEIPVYTEIPRPQSIKFPEISYDEEDSQDFDIEYFTEFLSKM